jgi:hypothetical protein
MGESAQEALGNVKNRISAASAGSDGSSSFRE